MDTTIQSTINAFLASLNTAYTRQTYATPLRHFCAFLSEQDILPEESAEVLTVDHAIRFVPWLRGQRPYKKATIETYLTATYRFYRHLLKHGYPIEAADLARLEEVYRDARAIRGESRPKDYKLEAVQAVISAARAAPASTGKAELIRLRDIAIVETLRSTGCREGELVGLRLKDVSDEGKSAQVKGKGSKYRWVYWDDTSWWAILAYQLKRQIADAASVLGNAPVFCGHSNRSNGAPLTTRHVSRIIRALGKRAGVEGVTPHYFRHVFATRALERTELALVQDLLGHASPVATRVYAKTNEKQRQNAHQKVWD